MLKKETDSGKNNKSSVKCEFQICWYIKCACTIAIFVVVVVDDGGVVFLICFHFVIQRNSQTGLGYIQRGNCTEIQFFEL